VVTEIGEPPVGKQRLQPLTPQVVSRLRETTPAQLKRALSGDLDNVLLKAMRKEPAARYVSAGAFREDLLRYGEGLPVLAKGRGWHYSAAKLLRRHQWWVAAFVVATAGMATGMIRISPVAAILAGIFLVIALLGQYGLKANFGNEYASRRRFHATVLGVFAATVLALWGNLLFQGAQLAQSACLLVGLYYLRILVRWPFRDRWAGRLLVKATRPTPRVIFFIHAGLAAYLTFCSVLMLGTLWWRYLLSAAIPFVAYRLWIWGKVEIRANGVLAHGHLVRWRRVQSYAWERTDPAVAMLRFQVTRFQRALHFSVPVIPQGKDAIAAALDEHLSEWPELIGWAPEEPAVRAE
jgi:hypothetical protein